MKPPPHDRGPTPEAFDEAFDDAFEEKTEERTVECLLEDLGEEVLDDLVEKASTTARVVGPGAEGDDRSGKLTPRERAVPRSRRATVSSPVPSQLAKSMMSVGPHSPARDPAAPLILPAEVTRRVSEANQAIPLELNSGSYSVELVTSRSGSWRPTSKPATREQPIAVVATAAVLVERACAYMKQGLIGEAVVAADQAIATNERTGQLEESHLKDIANGPLSRVFFAGGFLNRVPLVARAERELDALTIDELHWAVLRRMDGRRTIAQVFGSTKIPAIDALRIAASLFQSGVIRIGDRALG